jgi:hypothetical protein
MIKQLSGDRGPWGGLGSSMTFSFLSFSRKAAKPPRHQFFGFFIFATWRDWYFCRGPLLGWRFRKGSTLSAIVFIVHFLCSPKENEPKERAPSHSVLWTYLCFSKGPALAETPRLRHFAFGGSDSPRASSGPFCYARPRDKGS